jgi:hypothetical protein
VGTRARSALAGRGFLLFPAAAFAVHQLRYQLTYGSRTGAALAAQGHGYQNSLAPWVVVLLAVGLGSFLARFARAAAGREDVRRRRSFAGLFVLSSVLLLATYSLQEWLESVFVSGHPGGLAGIFGHGGWWAVPLALAAGLAVAALLALASAAVEAVTQLSQRRVLVAPGQPQPRISLPGGSRSSVLGRGLAGRAPPRLALV